jgi:cell division transport system permease protein
VSFALRGVAWKIAQRVVARRPWTLLLAIAMVAAVLVPPVFTGLLAASAHANLSITQFAPEAVVFVTRGTDSAAVTALRHRVQALDGVSAVRWIARDAAWAEIASRSSLPANEARTNPLPDVLVVRMRFGARSEELEQVTTDIGKLPRVDSVQTDLGWYRRLGKWLELVRGLVWATGAGAVALAGAILVGAARLFAAAAPEDLRALRLMGAEPWFIRRPFAYLGALIFLTGASLATGIAFAGFQFVSPAVSELAADYGLQWLPWWPPGTAIAAGIAVLGVLGAWIGGWGVGRSADR